MKLIIKRSDRFDIYDIDMIQGFNIYETLDHFFALQMKYNDEKIEIAKDIKTERLIKLLDDFYDKYKEQLSTKETIISIRGD